MKRLHIFILIILYLFMRRKKVAPQIILTNPSLTNEDKLRLEMEERYELLSSQIEREAAANRTVTSSVSSLANLSLVGRKAPSIISKPSLQVDNTPLYVFSVNNDYTNQNRQIVNCIYLDSLYSNKVDVSISGRPFLPINPRESGTKSIPLTSATVTPGAVSVNNLVTPVSAVATKIKYLPIGDSITASPVTEADLVLQNYWGYASKAMYNNLRDRVDTALATIPTPAMVMLGHLNFRTKTSMYKETSITVKGGNAAQSGWAGCHYLYHAITLSAKLIPPAGFLSFELSYYILGLKTQTGVNFSGNVTQAEQVRTTIMGKYTCDKIALLYDYMKVQPGWPGAVDAYTGSGTQTGHMDTYLESVLDNPINPFYSKTKARTGGATNAFSLVTYLARYKTLADDGVTRLVVGSTAGTKVTNATDYDVCTPSHVTFNFGENDIFLFPDATLTQIATAVRDLANVVTTEFPTAKIGILTNPYPGTNFPELFPAGIRNTKPSGYTKKSDLRAALISNLGVTTSTVKVANIYYIDAFMFMYPLSNMFDQAGETAGGTIDFAETIISGVHPGLKAQASLGDQVYGWLYYSTNN